MHVLFVRLEPHRLTREGRRKGRCSQRDNGTCRQWGRKVRADGENGVYVTGQWLGVVKHKAPVLQ